VSLVPSGALASGYYAGCFASSATSELSLRGRASYTDRTTFAGSAGRRLRLGGDDGDHGPVEEGAAGPGVVEMDCTSDDDDVVSVCSLDAVTTSPATDHRRPNSTAATAAVLNTPRIELAS